MSEENIKIQQAIFDGLNAHDLDRNDRLFADDFVGYAPGAPGPTTHEQAKMVNQGFLTAFPDLHFDITLTLAQGDYVVTHWTGTGTHTGPLPTPSGNTIPPTGKKATVMGSSTAEIKNGKVTRGWQFWDMTSLLGQLGLLPPM
jgi:predicted ester cyclase